MQDIVRIITLYPEISVFTQRFVAKLLSEGKHVHIIDSDGRVTVKIRPKP